jgi:hypothetical protein
MGNLLWWLGLPAIFAIWLSREVRWEYEMGYRVSTDGDSIAIPVAGVFMANTVLLLLLNAAVFAVRRLRSRKRPPNQALQGTPQERRP